MITKRVILPIIAILLSGVCYSVFAQTKKDTLTEVNITTKRDKTGNTKVNDFSPGQKVVVIDTNLLKQYKMQSMANLIAQQMPVFVKMLSFNGVATLNFRGSSAAQSQVYWNGVPVQNAALGIADVSALPVMFMTKASIVYGGSAALHGSGNVGGALFLNSWNEISWGKKKELSVSSSAGSFGQYSAGVDGIISNSKWYLSSKLFFQTANNNFSYSDAGVQKKMTNGQLQSKSAMIDVAHHKTGKSTVGLSAWVQQYDREIPPALFETNGSVKRQLDGAVRLVGYWFKTTHYRRYTWNVKSSYFRDNINYDDASIVLHTRSVAEQYYQEVLWTNGRSKYGKLAIFTPLQISWIKTPISNEIRSQSKLALAGAYDVTLLHKKLDIAINGRAEAIDTQKLLSSSSKRFLLLGADGSYALTSWLSLRANIQRTYRVPTLNELYYYPGGNTALKPEQGWSKDAGYTVKATHNNITLFHDVSVFDRNINDWIIWLGGAIWTPHNIARVHSRGVETENRVMWKINDWQMHVGLNTAYVLATTVNSYIFNDGSIGKQIPYTPRYNGQVNIGLAYKNLYLNYNHTYTGYRFTVSDESDYLMPYNTGNLQLMYASKIRKYPVQFTGQCNNIWNNQYTIMFSRPMPGINWVMGVRVMVNG